MSNTTRLGKAFDNISHSSLLKTLKRYKVPPKLLNIIKNVYDNPTFYVYLQNAYSDYHTQQAGIRQGCPLSPYLFVMVMSALWQDIYQALPNTNAHEILYADDTLLYSRIQQTQQNATRSRNRILKIRPRTKLR